MKIRVKLSLGETSAMDRQKWCGTHLTGLAYRVRTTPVDAITRLWYKKINGMNILQQAFKT